MNTAQGPVASSCEDGNEYSRSIKSMEFIYGRISALEHMLSGACWLVA
jgi:hypothetical protein